MIRKLIAPASLLFYVQSLIVFFILGLIYAGITDAAKGQGLAGGAIVLFYGISFAFAALFFALLMVSQFNIRTIKNINKVLVLLLLLLSTYVAYKVLKRSKNQPPAQKEQFPPKVSSPAIPVSLISSQGQEKSMGMGFFAPNFYEHKTLYFYGNLNLEKAISDHLPYDSILFKQTERGIEIAKAPPWLAPKHMKMDYGILLFKLESLAYDFIEIEVNTYNQQKTYASKYAGKTILWPEFLLSVNSIELLDDINQKVKIKPLDHAGIVNTKYEFLRPIQVKQNWAKVNLLDNNLKKVDEGWVKWHENGKLLIRYSLLS